MTERGVAAALRPSILDILELTVNSSLFNAFKGVVLLCGRICNG